MTSTNCSNWDLRDGDNNCKITTTTAGEYVFCYDYSTDRISVLYPDANIAQGKTAVAGWSRRGSCPEPNENEIPDKAVDGEAGSSWLTYGCNNLNKSWLAIDLGRAYRLNHFSVVWNNSWGSTDYIPTHYQIQVMSETPTDFSDDVEMSDTRWVTVAEVNEAQSVSDAEHVYYFAEASGRYVRFVSLDKTTIALREFKVYADDFAEAAVVTPNITGAVVYSDLSDGSATLTLTSTDHNSSALHTFLLQDQTGQSFRLTTDASNHGTITGLYNRRYVFTVWAVEKGNLSAESKTVIVGEIHSMSRRTSP